MNLVRKSMFTALITLSTASVYYAQSVKDTLSKEKSIDEVVISGVADIAKDRKTPVAVSTIKEAQIIEKLGNQEFPEILNTTPSVYATKGGGGFGDSNLNIRGFSQSNIAVLINGVPVNDMENGAVYWSNWAGLSDVTSTLEVQRGLGSSKLAIASVGGTVNVITRSADRKEGGKFTLQVGNDGYVKTLASYNTGVNAKGWSSSFLLGRTGGSTYASGTHFEGYNYYFALGWKPNAKQDFQFTLTGAPQYHNQRAYEITLQTLINRGSLSNPDRRYNEQEGVLNGQEYTFKRNYFNKPVMSLNWNWNISDKSKLNTVAYASFGRGGGTGNTGSAGGKSLSSFTNADGLVNFDAIIAANQASTPDKGYLTRYSSINAHNWFGLITSFNHKINDNLNFSLGFDGRYYKGFHYRLVSDLLGGTSYKDTSNKHLAGPNYVSNTYDANPTFNPFGGKIDPVSDRITYSNVDQVLWYGGFGQIEYSNDNLSAFAQGSISEQGFQRHDDFYLDGTVTKGGVLKADSPYKNLFGYNAKVGANYNIDEKSNFFVNGGYYSKQPFFNAVYPNNNSLVNPYLTNEKIFGLEAGYGFKSSVFNGKINLYRTSWKDRYQRTSYTSPDKTVTGYSNITGITEIHSGVEFEGNARVAKIIQLNGSLSIGNWVYKGNAKGFTYNDANAAIDPATGLESTNNTGGTTLFLDKIKVGNSAQTTASLGFTLFPVKDFKFDANYRYVNHLYANLNVTDFSIQSKAANGALELPSYGLFDIGASYKFRLPNPKQSFTIRANVYNLLNTYYLQDSYTNTFAGDKYSTGIQYKGVDTGNQVFFGFGRTWSTAVAFNF